MISIRNYFVRLTQASKSPGSTASASRTDCIFITKEFNFEISFWLGVKSECLFSIAFILKRKNLSNFYLFF